MSEQRYRIDIDADGELRYHRVDESVTGSNVYDVCISDGNLLHIKKENLINYQKYDKLILDDYFEEATKQVFEDLKLTQDQAYDWVKERAYILARKDKPKEFLQFYDSNHCCQYLEPYARIALVYKIWKNGYNCGSNSALQHEYWSRQD